MGRRLIPTASASAVGAIVGVLLAVPAAVAHQDAALRNVVFERTAEAGNADVIVTSEQGKPQSNITADSLTNESSPAFAPGAKSVAFTTDRGGRFELWRANSDGTNPRPLTPSGGSDVNPSYSPDGKWVAFACNVHGNWDICIVTPAGKGRRNLTNDSATELDPSWSPDSQQVVFDRIEAQRSDIWSVSPRGGAPTNLTPQSPLDELDPTLSKDGRLAFDAIDAKGNYDIYVTTPGSTQATRLTTDPAEDSAPVYSPDGKRLLFVSARKGDYEIYLMNADGSGQRDLSNSPATADVGPNFASQTRAPASAYGRSAGRAPSTAGSFPCSISGTPGNDNLSGDNNPNRLCAKAGNDLVRGWGANDLIDGGPGNDKMYGDGDQDTLYARAGIPPDKDSISGGKGTDTAFYDPTLDICRVDVEYCRTTS